MIDPWQLVVGCLCFVVGISSLVWYVWLSITWRRRAGVFDMLNQFFSKSVQTFTFFTMLSGSFYGPLHALAPYDPNKMSFGAYTRSIAVGLLVICVTSYVWNMKLRSEALLRDSQYYYSIVKVMLFTITICWVNFFILVIPSAASTYAALALASVVISGVTGLGVTAVSLILSTVFYRYIGSKQGMDSKYRPVYLVISRYGLILSALIVVGTIFIGLVTVSDIPGYAMILYIDIASVVLCLAFLKHQMNLRQQECDSAKTLQKAAANAASISMQDNPKVHQITYGNQSTHFDTESRVVAIPAYLQVDYKSFDVDADVLAEGGDSQVKQCTIVDPTLFTQWKARFELQSNRVAIKIFRTLPETDSKEQQQADTDRFLQEVSVFSSLQGHENIARFLGYTDSPKSLVMLMYDGSLRELIDDKSTLIPLTSVVRQILAALQEIHRYGITHCDIKPGNLLYRRSENTIQVALSDFGISQVKLASEKVETRHSVRLDAQSFSYSPPEILHSIMSSDAGSGTGGVQGKQMVAVELSERDNFLLAIGEADHPRDIYSFSIVIWELIARVVCWQDISRNDIYSMVLQLNIRPPHNPTGVFDSSRVRGVSDETLALVDQAARDYAIGYAAQQAVEGDEQMTRVVQIMSGSWTHDPVDRLEAKIALAMLQS